MNADGNFRVSIIFPDQYPQTALALSRAFINDPPMKAILGDVPDPADRARRLLSLFHTVLGIQRRMGEPVLGVIERGSVAAAAIVAGTSHTSTAAFLALGIPHMTRMVPAVGWGGVRRSLELMDVLARNHPPERHIYLNFLGVDPDYQRKHFGGAILEELRRLAAQRTDVAGVYLEAATETNVAYYSARGYQVLGEVYPLGVRIWRMFQPKRAVS